MANEQKLLTVGDLAKVLRRSNHQVTYAIARSGIEPVQRAGVIRLFHPAQVNDVKSALQRTAGQTEVRHG